MRVALAVAKLEVLLLLRDRRFVIAGLILWGMLGTLLWVGQSQFVVQQQRIAEAQHLAREQWVNRPDGGPHGAAHVGTFVYRPATPLSLLHPGAQPYMGVAAHLEAHNQTNLFYRPILDHASIVRWADISAAALLQVIIPLLLLLLACGSIAGDREEGRLLLSISQGAPATAFALGKMAGVIITASLLLIPVLAIVVGILGRASAVVGSPPDQIARLVVLIAGYGGAYFFFLSMGIAISAFSTTRQVALLISVGLWAVLCLITPRTLIAVSESLFPTMERDDVRAAIKEELTGVDKVMAIRKRVEDEAMIRYKVKRKEDLPIKLGGLYLQAGEDWGNAVTDRHEGKILTQFQAQDKWTARWGFYLSPFMPLVDLGETLSGTDSATLRGFLRHVELYRRDWERRLNNALTHMKGDRVGKEVWSSIPEFRYDPPSLAQLKTQTERRLIVLWLWALLGGAAAVYSVHRRCGSQHSLS